MNYTIEKITTLLGARRIGTADAQIGWLLTDSRSLCFPEETLFFALKTARNDGHRYISDLYRRGVRTLLSATCLPTCALTPTTWWYHHRWKPCSDWLSVIVTSSTYLLWALRVPMERRW